MSTTLRKTRKKRLGSYPYLTVVFTITVALLVFGLFGLLLLHTGQLSRYIRNNIEVHVYLQKNISSGERVRLAKTLEAKPFTAIKDNKPQLRFISKDEAAKEFIAETGENFINFLGANPLRDAYVLRVDQNYTEAKSMENIRSEIEKIEGVFEVEYAENFIKSINDNLTKISLALLGFAFVLLFTIIILINNVIKLALFSQRFLIRSMQLVGATSWFIQRPFVWRAALQGFVGGVLAAVVLYFLLQYANTQIPDLKLIQVPTHIALLFVSLAIGGMFIGFISAWFSVRKYLRLSLDDLY